MKHQILSSIHQCIWISQCYIPWVESFVQAPECSSKTIALCTNTFPNAWHLYVNIYVDTSAYSCTPTFTCTHMYIQCSTELCVFVWYSEIQFNDEVQCMQHNYGIVSTEETHFNWHKHLTHTFSYVYHRYNMYEKISSTVIYMMCFMCIYGK